MRLSEPIETIGFFWLPQDSDKRLPGVLRISNEGDITVELVGFIDNPRDVFGGTDVAITPALREEEPGKGQFGTIVERDVGRVVGMVDRGGLVTLEQCTRGHTSLPLLGGLCKSMLHSRLALLGTAYDPQDDVAFLEVSFQIEGLDAWLGVSGIRSEALTTDGGTIQFGIPSDIPLCQTDDVGLEVFFEVMHSRGSFPFAEARVRQTASVFAKSKEPRSIEYFSSLAHRLCNFLSFSIDQAVSITSMSAYLNEPSRNSDDVTKKKVAIYGKFAPWTERVPTIDWHRMVVRYADIANQVDTIVAKWFESYEEFEPAFNLYFATRDQPSSFLDFKILWITQALEVLHRRSSNETLMPDESFQKLYDGIIEHCPAERQSWLREKLRYANELTLRRRLRLLLEPFKQLFGSVGQREHFVNRVCDTRNYLTHYDENSTPTRASTPHELVALYDKLDALFQLQLFRLLGLDDATIDNVVRGDSGIRRKLES